MGNCFGLKLGPQSELPALLTSDFWELSRAGGLCNQQTMEMVSFMTKERASYEDPVRGVALLILLAVFGSGVSGVLRYFGESEVPNNNVLASSIPENSVPKNSVPSNKAPVSTASPIQFQVNLNEATLHELALLPMVGPRMAELIVQERARLGAFTELEQLSEIPGVGPKVMESLRPHVTIR